jgi:uncharacterized paraquat-inducible protein A
VTCERYQLACFGCEATVEVPAGAPNDAEMLRCPRCGSSLETDWRSVATVPVTGEKAA